MSADEGDRFETKPLKTRIEEARRIIRQHPTRVPVIIQRGQSCNIPALPKIKYLVPRALRIGELLITVRKNLPIESTDAIFMYCGSTLVTAQHTCEDLYQKYRNSDGFLYMDYALENTFGGENAKKIIC